MIKLCLNAMKILAAVLRFNFVFLGYDSLICQVEYQLDIL